MPDTRNRHQSAIWHRRCHRPQIRGGNPAILLSPKHQVLMLDLRHALFQFTAFPLQVQIEGRSKPYALGHFKRLLNQTFVERLELTDTVPKPGHSIRLETLRNE